LKIALTANSLQPTGIDVIQNHLFLVAGNPGKGKSTVLASMVCYMLRSGNAKVYVKDSLSSGLYAIANMENVADLDEIGDEYEFSSDFGQLLDGRRSELNECRRSGGDTEALKAGWQPIIFVIDNLVEFTENDSGTLVSLLERVAKKEAGLRVSVWAAGNTEDLNGAYDTLVKAFKDAQCGVLLGSIRERSLFNVSLSYGSYEKPEFGPGEGYLIIRNKFTGIKAAVDVDII